MSDSLDANYGTQEVEDTQTAPQTAKSLVAADANRGAVLYRLFLMSDTDDVEAHLNYTLGGSAKSEEYFLKAGAEGGFASRIIRCDKNTAVTYDTDTTGAKVQVVLSHGWQWI